VVQLLQDAESRYRLRADELEAAGRHDEADERYASARAWGFAADLIRTELERSQPKEVA
jgi:hypothetical protein